VNKLVASDAAQEDFFGATVDLSGEIAVVGASEKATNDYDTAGAAYVYQLSAPVIDLGFRPNPDGYPFENYGGVDFGDYTIEDMRRMFGDEAVCAQVYPTCRVRFAALLWNDFANRAMAGGHCEGMAATSLRFFQGLEEPYDFQQDADTTYGLALGNVRRHIAYYWAEQLVDPVGGYKEWVRQQPPSTILTQIRDRLSGDAPDPPTLFVRGTLTMGHALTPYAIIDKGGGEFSVSVYDSNHPADAGRSVEIDTTAGTWHYDLGGLGVWSGDDNTHSLGYVPLSVYSQQPVCPWCSWTRRATEAPQAQVWLTGPGHLVLTDSQGRRIGYIGDQFVSQVPGAYANTVYGGLGAPTEPIYVIPLTETYSIFLDGATLTQTGTVKLGQFGPGYAAWLNAVNLTPGAQDDLFVAADGHQLAYRAAVEQEATLGLAIEDAARSEALQIQGSDVGAGQVVTLTNEVDAGRLVYSHARADGGDYDLKIKRADAEGVRTFVHAGVEISATDTHLMDYGVWRETGTISLSIDHGSDGSVDATVVLDNQIPHIFLPLLIRNG
jgi:hypothetical protein